MGQIILHKDGVYNIYSTISGECLYEDGLNLNELEQEIQEEFGNSGLRELPSRLERAHKTGTSSLVGKNLEDSIICRHEDISVEKFYGLYLNKEVLDEEIKSKN